MRWRFALAVGLASRTFQAGFAPLQSIGYLAAGGECARDDIEAVIEKLSDGFLRPGDRGLMSGGRDRWKVMIRRARKPLKAEGWIASSTGKTWKITEAGRRAAERPATEPASRP